MIQFRLIATVVCLCVLQPVFADDEEERPLPPPRERVEEAARVVAEPVPPTLPAVLPDDGQLQSGTVNLPLYGALGLVLLTAAGAYFVRRRKAQGRS